MVATAQTWSPVTAALVRQLTRASPAPRRTAAQMTRASTVVLVTALGCAAVHLGTQVVTALQLLNHSFIFVFKFLYGQKYTHQSLFTSTIYSLLFQP